MSTGSPTLKTSPSRKNVRPSQAPRKRWWRSRGIIAWTFMLPLAVVNLTVILGPSLATVYYSFTNWSGLGPAEFIGFENYRNMLTDGAFYQALWHNVIWTAIFLTVPIAMGLLGAALLSQITRFQIFFRIAFFIPYVVASVVNAALWENILAPNRGIAEVLANLGFPFLQGVAFFGDPDLALFAVAFVDNWHYWGFVVVLFLTAMQSVDPELYEAAKIDGASPWQQFLNVTLPSIRPTLVFVMLMTFIWSMIVFDYIYILTQGGPAGASEVLSTLTYKEAFSRFEAGYAAAVGLSMSFISGMIIMIYLYMRRRGWEI